MADAKTTAVDAGSNVGARMTYEDMREWIIEAEKLGELTVVNGASWEKDIGLAAKALPVLCLTTFQVARLASA